jgi:hypothetical protein
MENCLFINYSKSYQECDYVFEIYNTKQRGQPLKFVLVYKTRNVKKNRFIRLSRLNRYKKTTNDARRTSGK